MFMELCPLGLNSKFQEIFKFLQFLFVMSGDIVLIFGLKSCHDKLQIKFKIKKTVTGRGHVLL